MGSAKQRTLITIFVMSTIAVLVILLYHYLVNRTEVSIEEPTEVEVLINKDLELYYPATPKEVVKLYSNMLQNLYTELEEDEYKALGLKMRELYDEELLEINSLDKHINQLSNEILEWKNAKRRIVNFSFDNDKDNLSRVEDGVEYQINNVSYTFEERSKFIEDYSFILRKDENNRWKILGWRLIPQSESNNDID
ncbi:MAG TPA: hypothetical protein GXZ21_13145 [Clostridiales bacterium]|nr:hypothetical protein [Clostridiales bacterium]